MRCRGQNWGNPDRLGVLETLGRDRVELVWVGPDEEAGPGRVLGCGGTSSPQSSWVIDKDGPGQSVSALLLAPRPEDAVQAQKVPESVASRSLKGPLSPLVNLKVTQIPGFLGGLHRPGILLSCSADPWGDPGHPLPEPTILWTKGLRCWICPELTSLMFQKGGC